MNLEEWREWFALSSFIAWCKGTNCFVSEILEKKESKSKIRYKVKVGLKKWKKIKGEWKVVGSEDIATAEIEVDKTTEPWGVKLVEWKEKDFGGEVR